MKTLMLPRPLVNQLLTQSQQDAEHEICGLIARRADGTLVCYPVENDANPSTTRFNMAPEAQLAAMRQMHEQNEQLLAIYHSHPHAPAYPSVEDLRQHEYPGALRLIISLNTKGVLELRGYDIQNGQIEELEISLPD